MKSTTFLATLFFVLVFCFTAGLPTAAATGPTPVHIDLEPMEITVGDPIEAELTLIWDGEAPAAMPRFPDWSTRTWGAAEVLAVGEVQAVSGRGGRHIYSLKLTLTAFETGDVELPPLEVMVSHAEGNSTRVPTRGAVFKVKSVLPGDQEGAESVALDLEPRPGAPLRTWPGDRRFLWTAGTLTALCLLAAGELRRRLRRAATGIVAGDSSSALLEPLEELLVSLKKIDPAACEPAHTALSQALRRFLGRCLGFNALESTTHEIRLWLERESPLAEDLAPVASQLLAECDQVKYAHAQVDAARTVDRLQSAEQWARQVELELRPPEPEPSEHGET